MIPIPIMKENLTDKLSDTKQRRPDKSHVPEWTIAPRSSYPN